MLIPSFKIDSSPISQLWNDSELRQVLADTIKKDIERMMDEETSIHIWDFSHPEVTQAARALLMQENRRWFNNRNLLGTCNAIYRQCLYVFEEKELA